MKKLLNKLDPPVVALQPLPQQQLVEQLPEKTLNNLIGKTYKLEKGNVVTIEEVIAEGGFGIVFLVSTIGNKTQQALKRIVVNNEQDLAVANREVAIMSTLGQQSPYILPCVDSLIQKLTPDVTEILSLSPFCRLNLLQILQKSQSTKVPLKEEKVLKITSDIIQGLARLHHCTTPIIHRDLKIENVLMTTVEGVDKFLICDFGSATGKFWDPSIHPLSEIIEDLEKFTTLSYRSPEMVDLYSNRGPITCKADIWALGVALYKMLYYVTPFGESVLSISSSRLDFPSAPVYSGKVQSLISYMLLADQNVRPDIFQVSELLHSLLNIPNPVANLNATKAWTFEEIDAYRKALLDNKEKVSKVVVSQPVVLETSVTPRQRPKAGQQGVAVVVQPLTLEPATIMPPPKSPKPERKITTSSGAPSSGAPSAPCSGAPSSGAPEEQPIEVMDNSWNPFATSSPTEMGTSTDDPFALAPFDCFKYQPMEHFGTETNPFLFPPDNNNIDGVTNYSFQNYTCVSIYYIFAQRLHYAQRLHTALYKLCQWKID